MTKLLIAGIGPLPYENPARLFAPALRTWTFGRELALRGHEIEIATLDFGGGCQSLRLHRLEPRSAEPVAAGLAEGMGLADTLRRLAADFRPDALVASSDAMGEAAALAKLELPLWIDYNGDPMAERQQQAFVYDHDGGLGAAWRTMLPALLAGDRFSTCSEAQRMALLGQLGACGRLNRLTAEAEFAHAIVSTSAFESFKKTRPALRGTVAAESAEIVLWTGGFNTWTDVETLHAGLAEAMRRRPALHFAATGGAISGHCEPVFEEFRRLIAAGPFAERFHLLGWVDLETVQNAYLEADLAINIDRFSHEGLLGTRTRILEWIAAGLPVLTTELCEFSRILAQRGLAFIFPIGDAGGLAEAICKALNDPERAREMAHRAQRFLREEHTNERLMRPLFDWAEKPRRAPDLAGARARCQAAPCWLPDNPLARAQLEWLAAGALAEELASERHLAERRRAALARLRGSRAHRWLARWTGHSLEE